MVVIGSIGFAKGHPERLTYPYDPDDNACGLSDKVIDYPYIYLASPFPDYFNRSVCVKKCPYWVNSSDKPKELECMKNKIIESCEENYDYYSAIQADIDSFANNSFIIYNTSSLFGRFCIVIV